MTDHPYPHRGDRLSEGPGGNRVTGSGPSRVARSDEGAARTIARQAYAAGAPARLGPLPTPEQTGPHP